MLNMLWAGMMAVGIFWAAFHENMGAVTNGLLDSAKEAVTLGVTMLGIMSFWCGILKIGERAGLIEALTEKMRPVIRFLFPNPPGRTSGREIYRDKYDCEHAGTRLGGDTGWVKGDGRVGETGGRAAGEKAPDKRKNTAGQSSLARQSGTASNEMCTFLIVNISSLQLIPINMIAYRSQYGSVSPAAIAGPALLATIASTAAGITFCKVMDRKNVDF